MLLKTLKNRIYTTSLFLMLILPLQSVAQVSIQVLDQNDAPLADATLVLTPLFETEPGPAQEVQVEQFEEQFVPRVTIVQRGANIFFPNRDQIRHHVYSFSQAKQFDIPLYSGTPSEPITFDQSGLVVLGCNIHDQMRGYILVSDSPFFAVSDAEGSLSIDLEVAGDYELSLWHPEQKQQLDTIQISIGEDLSFAASYQLETARLFVPRRSSSSGGYF